jgi:hypothetical protein
MKLVIGCPIYNRDWILNHWFKCIFSQSIDLENIGFIFEAAPDDDKTISILKAVEKIQKNIPHFSINIREDIPHFQHIPNGRQWTLSKYENMVSLRNSLLKKVRELEPDYYFSLDSDILIQNPNTLELLIAHIKSGADAVSPLMFMTPTGDLYPSVMNWRQDQPNKAMRNSRYPLGTYFKSDVIMAAKMMSKKVYQGIDYKVHEQGEDLGWCLNARDNGYKLYSASYIYAPHIMSIEMYEDFLKNGDNRPIAYSNAVA